MSYARSTGYERRGKMPKKKYKIVKIEEKLHGELLKMQALYYIDHDTSITISDVIEKLMNQQPAVEISTRKARSSSI